MFLTIVTIKCIIDKLEFKLDNDFNSLKLNTTTFLHYCYCTMALLLVVNFTQRISRLCCCYLLIF